MYYVKNDKLYAIDYFVTDSDFVEITEDEYNRRMDIATRNREQGAVDSSNGNEVEIW